VDLATFFVLENAWKLGAFVAEAIDRGLNSWDISQGKVDPPSPCRFKRNCGTKPYDFMISGFAALDLLSPRTIRVLHAGQFSGWRSFPVQITGKKKVPIEGYEGLVVTGRCGPIDWSKAKKVRKPPRSRRGRPYEVSIGMYFDPASWDGSDFFMPEGTTFCIVTEPVKASLEKEKITNVHFTSLTQFERFLEVV